MQEEERVIGRLAAAAVHTARRRSCGCSGGGGSARRAHREGRVGVGVGGREALEAFHSSVHPGNVKRVSPSLAETLKQS